MKIFTSILWSSMKGKIQGRATVLKPFRNAPGTMNQNDETSRIITSEGGKQAIKASGFLNIPQFVILSLSKLFHEKGRKGRIEMLETFPFLFLRLQINLHTFLDKLDFHLCDCYSHMF